MNDLLAGFDERRIDAGGVAIRVRTRGSGPPVLLLHGYPETLTMWHLVAPVLSDSYTVVLADLRGYGESDKPRGDEGHVAYSKRAMAADLVAVMARLGHQRFSVIGHDRGGRVGHRLALDHPDRVNGLCVLDIVPTLHMFSHVDRAMAASYFHWFFLSLESDLPEQLIDANPDAWLHSRFAGRNAGGLPVDPKAFEEYARCFHDPRVVHATCEDYRAAATIDLEHDRDDAARARRIEQPFAVLWGKASYVGRHFDVLACWSDYAASVGGHAINADHYLPEEAPEQTGRAIAEFLGSVPR